MEKVDFTFKRAGHTRVMPRRQAEILGKLGHGTYQTRMLSAEVPMQPVIVPVAVELDAEGSEWNPVLHVASKLKNMNGTWRKKPGASPAE